MSTVPPRKKLTRHAPGWAKGTAAKTFFVMMLVLMPLAIVATITDLQFLRSADNDKRELLQTATRQNAGQLASNINAIRTSQQMTANVFASDPAPGNICGRLTMLFRTMGGKEGISAVIADLKGNVICASGDSRPLLNLLDASKSSAASGISLAPALKSILIRSSSKDGAIVALAAYRLPALQRLTSANIYDPNQRIELNMGDEKLMISRDARHAVSSRHKMIARAPVGNSGMNVSVTIDDDDTSMTRFLSLMMPLALLVSAAFLGWVVVRETLIKPLMILRREVAAYVPGEVMHPTPSNRLTSSEIGELGEAFHEMSENVAEHEEEMRQALQRQTQLTREVHHRVKNNLQIISSLISLHWRAAADPGSAVAYLSIQRRVDALAVVQRNHYAELDEKRGVRARPMMNEIASGLKTSAQIQSGCNLDIAIDCDDIYLHQDIAAPLAFMTAELADLVIATDNAERFYISMLRVEGSPHLARFALSAPAFCNVRSDNSYAAGLYDRVLVGLARQLRTPLEHDTSRGEYHVIVPVIS